MPVFIPTFPDLANYTMTTTLDGTPYEFTFRLSERERCYYLDLALTDGTLLVGGKKIVCLVSLFRHHRYNPLVPQGHLGVISASGQSDEPPYVGELGDGRRCSLFYATLAEVGS